MDNLAPVLLSLLAAVFFAIGVQVITIALRHLDARTGTMIDIVSAAVLFWLLAPFFLESAYFWTTAAVLFAVSGLIRPALSATMATMGVRHLGPTLSSTLASVSPVFGVVFGVSLLGERVTPGIAVGTAAIVVGCMVLSKRDKIRTTWPLWALALPLGAAAIRALSHAVAKIGLAEVPSVLFASLMTYTVSTFVAFSAHAVQPQTRLPAVPLAGWFWFGLSGFVHSIAVLLMNSALFLGDVIVVLPLVSASPLFTLLLSLYFFKNEIITPRIVAGVFIVIPGVIVIGLSRL